MITADEVRRLIVAHDASRPRSRQTAIGPSDLSSPCDRQIGYKVLGVERVTSNDVNLWAYVGTGLHTQLEKACKADNKRLGRTRWLTETRVSVPVTDTVSLTGSSDAYDSDTFTVVDWKGRGTSNPDAKTRDKHHSQLLPYAFGHILAGRVVDWCAVVYVPRNGLLSDIEVDIRRFDPDATEALLRRYEAILTATAVGPAILPHLPVVGDCRFCGWWQPGATDLTAGCPGEPPTSTTALPPWEPQEETSRESTRP